MFVEQTEIEKEKENKQLFDDLFKLFFSYVYFLLLHFVVQRFFLKLSNLIVMHSENNKKKQQKKKITIEFC